MDDRPFDNPQPIDDSILESIESGELNLTDQLFFKLTKETPLYLGQWPFQKRIAQWQYYLNNHLYSDVEQKDAKKKLLQIGRALAYEQKGRPGKIPDLLIYNEYKKAVEIIDPFLQEHKDDGMEQRVRAFKSTFTEHCKYVNIRRHRSASEIAICILMGKYVISKRSIQTIIKNMKGMADNRFIQKVLRNFIVHGTDNEISRAEDIKRAVKILKQNNINISDAELERLISTHPHN